MSWAVSICYKPPAAGQNRNFDSATATTRVQGLRMVSRTEIAEPTPQKGQVFPRCVTLQVLILLDLVSISSSVYFAANDFVVNRLPDPIPIRDFLYPHRWSDWKWLIPTYKRKHPTKHQWLVSQRIRASRTLLEPAFLTCAIPYGSITEVVAPWAEELTLARRTYSTGR